MKTLIDNYKLIYPKIPVTDVNGSIVVEEPDNLGNPTKFQSLEINGINGFAFDHYLAKNMSSFAQIASPSTFYISGYQWDNILYDDCDRIILFEKNGQKYMLFCELKSGYFLKQIFHARCQLLGSYIKMKGLMSTVRGFAENDFIPIGLIVSFESTSEQRDFYSKKQGFDASFVRQLDKDKKVDIIGNKSPVPFNYSDFRIYHCGVPNMKVKYSIDINTIIP